MIRAMNPGARGSALALQDSEPSRQALACPVMPGFPFTVSALVPASWLPCGVVISNNTIYDVG
jgi:hypothetical protein